MFSVFRVCSLLCVCAVCSLFCLSGCAEEILTVVAMLSVQSVFHRPKEKQAQADQKRAKFFAPEGDHLTLLTVYQAWAQSNFSNQFAFENFVQARQLRRAQDVRKQLASIMERYKLPIESCGKNWNRVQKAVCSGYFVNAAKKGTAHTDNTECTSPEPQACAEPAAGSADTTLTSTCRQTSDAPL